jgi:hypothetical protein
MHLINAHNVEPPAAALHRLPPIFLIDKIVPTIKVKTGAAQPRPEETHEVDLQAPRPHQDR